MAGRGADEGGRKPAGSGEPKAARVRAQKHGPGDRKAAMERREAPAFSKRERGETEDWCAAWRSIPSGLPGGKERGPAAAGTEYGAPHAAKNRGDGARLIETWLFEN